MGDDGRLTGFTRFERFTFAQVLTREQAEDTGIPVKPDERLIEVEDGKRVDGWEPEQTVGGDCGCD